jgi:hypothetical protein
MEEIEKVLLEPVNEAAVLDAEEEKEVFERGDACVFCGVCDTVSPINNENFINVKGGIQLPFLATTNRDMLSLGCPNCGAVLTLGFLASPETIEKEAENASIENKEEQTI